MVPGPAPYVIATSPSVKGSLDYLTLAKVAPLVRLCLDLAQQLVRVSTDHSCQFKQDDLLSVQSRLDPSLAYVYSLG